MTKLGLPKGFRGNKRKYSLPKRINGYLVLRTEEVSYFVRGGGGGGGGGSEGGGGGGGGGREQKNGWIDGWTHAC